MSYTRLKSIAAVSVAFLASVVSAQDAPAAAPKFLFDENPVHSASVIANPHKTFAVTPTSGGIDILVAGSKAGYPGFGLQPIKGKTWDLSPWGHVKARVTNTGKSFVSLNMRVDNAGEWKDNPWNTESVSLRPGESKEVKVIFGYQYGKKPGFKLDPSKVVQILFFVTQSDKDRSFRIEDVQAGGPAGEKPPVNPASIREIPQNGVIVGTQAQFKYEPKIDVKGDVKADWKNKKAVVIDLAAGKSGSMAVRPSKGLWNLKDVNAVKFTVRNSGTVPANPRVRVESVSGYTQMIKGDELLAPGASKTFNVSFVPVVPWTAPEMPTKQNKVVKGTGTLFEGNRVNGVAVYLTNEEKSAAQVELTSVVGYVQTVKIPEWLGKRPPIEGDWKLTMDENFDGDSINLNMWNIYTANFWDKRTHFTKDNVIVKDGQLILRYEEKTGYHNDNPNDKSRVAKTDFACGFADSYGKWTQRYGYFEARMKLPECPGLWPAFWTMPDRGGPAGPEGHKTMPQWKRASTHAGGMEFDIMEHLTGWGPYRFNCAFHWDGYDKEHKACGTSNIYVQPDEEGYITIGLLWLPGKAVYYSNGQVFGVWEGDRVCNVQSYPIFYMVSGGWANVPLDPSQLPADFVIDYFRAWQRTDLATPEDGPKANDGGPKSQF